MKIDLTFLGTGTSSGVPMIGCGCPVCTSDDPRDNRLRTSALVCVDGWNIVIDCGMDFRAQMLRNCVTSLDCVLLTHPHMDHIGGLDDLRAFNYFKGGPCDIYCSSFTAQTVQRMFYYAFEKNPYPGAPKLDLHIIDGAPFTVGPVSVVPIEGIHMKMHVFGYRIGGLVYITDMNSISDSELQKAFGCRVLVINALRRKPHNSHFTLDQALSIAERVGAETTYLTHLSHQMGPYRELEPLLPRGVHCAYDGLKIENI